MKFLYWLIPFEQGSDTGRKARVRMEEHVQAGRWEDRQIRLSES